MDNDAVLKKISDLEASTKSLEEQLAKMTATLEMIHLEPIANVIADWRASPVYQQQMVVMALRKIRDKKLERAKKAELIGSKELAELYRDEADGYLNGMLLLQKLATLDFPITEQRDEDDGSDSDDADDSSS